MSADYSSISFWFDEGRAMDVTHMLVICDGASWSDCCHPVYLKPDEDVHDVIRMSTKRIMEVYNYHLDKAGQMAEYRSWHP